MPQNKTIILSDSTSDLGSELIEKYSIGISPLCIMLNGKSYKDGIEITPNDIFENYNKNKTLPKSTCANIDEHREFIKSYVDKGYEVVYFTISSEFSGNYQNASIAAEEFPNVYVVDSRNLSTGIALQVLRAARLADEGKSAKEIYDAVLPMREKVDASFVIDTLEFLRKGGRCSSLAALGANLLKLKPCIEVVDGKMRVGKKYRDKMINVMAQYAKDRLSDLESIDPSCIFITHSYCDQEIVDEIYSIVKELNYFEEIHITLAGSTICTHCGQGTLGVLFVRK